jgi:hypothetical protein
MKTLIMLLCFVCILTSCEQDDVPSANLSNTSWKVVSLDNVSFEQDYVLHFKQSSFEIKLDVNTYVGQFECVKNQLICHSIVGTKLCCDSNQALRIIQKLENTNPFYVKNHVLYVNGLYLTKVFS